MQKQVTVIVPNARGEEGLTQACKRGELFRNDSEIEKYYSKGYSIQKYAIVDVDGGTNATNPRTIVKVFLER
jgi:hypothetical protein